MKNEQIIEMLESPNTGFIYGEMYGLHECVRDERRFLKIEKKDLRLSVQKDCLIYQWGWPGPDINFYKFKDYGDTWAFRREDIHDKNCNIED